MQMKQSTLPQQRLMRRIWTSFSQTSTSTWYNSFSTSPPDSPKHPQLSFFQTFRTAATT